MSEMMKCGHAAQGIDDKGNPVCVICYPDPRATQEDESPPDLTGRTARCSYYGQKFHYGRYGCECSVCRNNSDWICRCERPSSDKLAFFVYKGAGSPKLICKNCHFIHEGECPTNYKGNRGEPGKEIPGHEKWAGKFYEPDVKEFDEFYCGCRGWD